jgi:arabinofuranan 3-O-arabinosyltransferase
VLPLLASLGARGLVPRSPWFWVGLVPQLPTVSLPDLQAEHRRAFRDAFTLAMLFVATARECLRPAPSAEGSSAPVASGERPVSP